MHTVLIIDDEKDNLEALQRLLRNDFQVTVCLSPLEALKIIQKQEFSVLVSDQRMPEMTGVDFFEKARVVAPNSTRVLLTGYTDLESVILAINKGHIYHYISKPWEPEDFKLSLLKACEHYQLKKEVTLKNVELQSANNELNNALDELKLLDKAKARFLNLVSHELNTPLTVLNSFIALLNDTKEKLPDEIQKMISHLDKAIQRYNEIISEVLLFVKAESQSPNRNTTFHLSEEIGFGLLSFKNILSAKKIKIVNSVPKTITLTCDYEMMRLALRKLFEEFIAKNNQGSLAILEKEPSDFVKSFANIQDNNNIPLIDVL
jgi:response regulator RpfG family c-di-GMP phosphodiesterase